MKPRRIWTAEEKFNVVLEVLQGNKTVAETCREKQISCNQFYKWKEAFLQSALEGLKNKRYKINKDPITEENRKLLRLVGRYALMVEEQKKIFQGMDGES